MVSFYNQLNSGTHYFRAFSSRGGIFGLFVFTALFLTWLWCFAAAIGLTRDTTQKVGPACRFDNLTSGATYRTTNGVFEYTIRDIVDPLSRESFFSAPYDGTPLTNCSVREMTLFSSLATYEMKVEATVNCSLAKKVNFVASVPSRVSFDTRNRDDTIFNTTTKPLSVVLPRILPIYGDQLFHFVLRDGRLKVKLSDVGATGIYFKISLGERAQLKYVEGELYDPISSLSYAGAIEYVSDPKSVQAIENYVRILWSAILTDLGAESTSNVLTDAELLRSTVPTLMPELPLYLNNTYRFKTPLDPVEPTQLNARHMCHQTALVPFTIDIPGIIFLTVWLLILIFLTFSWFTMGNDSRCFSVAHYMPAFLEQSKTVQSHGQSSTTAIDKSS
ncbi:hypothetical protein BDV93DRAFT_548151 [Ceratobasidium sp. AG-I]|nr:hypothetical protein BDV93DRAFT_548151 [Ceratobasidium sp. AG-I]